MCACILCAHTHTCMYMRVRRFVDSKALAKVKCLHGRKATQELSPNTLRGNKSRDKLHTQCQKCAIVYLWIHTHTPHV